MTSKGRRHAVSASAWPPVIEGGVAPPPSRPNLAVSWASEGSAPSPLLGTPARPAKKAGIRQRLGGYNRLGTGCRDRKSTRLTPVTNAHLVCRLLLEKKN